MQTYGWDKTGGVVTAAGSMDKAVLAGTVSQSKRMEALKLNFKSVDGAKLEVNAHVQQDGWQGWKEVKGEDVVVGTTGQSKRMEAVKLSVTGLVGSTVWYRAHVQTDGWMDWVKATESKDLSKDFAGTVGASKRLEAIEIVVIPTADNDLFEAKQKALKELNEIVNPEDYKTNAEDLADVIEEYAGLISDAPSVTEVQRILGDAKLLIEQIASDAELAEDAEEAAEVKAKLVETAFENTLKTTAVRGSKDIKFLDDRAIKSAVENAKATIKTAKTVEEASELYDQEADKILVAVKEYVEEYINDVYNNGLTVEKVKYLLAEDRKDALVEKLENVIETPGDRATRMGTLISVLNDGNLGTDDSHATLNGDLRSLADVKAFNLTLVAEAKYTDMESKLDAIAEKVTPVLGITTDVEYARVNAEDALKALKDENVSKYSQVTDIVANAEASILATVKEYANDLMVEAKKEVGKPYYKTDTQLQTLKNTLNKKDVTAKAIVDELNTLFGEE